RPPGELPAVLQRNGSRPPGVVERRLLLDGDRAAHLHGLLLLPAAVLAARSRLDRDSRGRDRRGRDGRAADADENLVVRERRVLRRRGRRVLRGVQEQHVPGRLLLQHLDLHPLHGHPRRDGQRLGCARRGGVPLVPERVRARDDRSVDQHAHPLRLAPPEHRRAAVPGRHLRRDHPGGDALQARRAPPVETQGGRAPRGRARHAALRHRARRSGGVTSSVETTAAGDGFAGGTAEDLLLEATELRKEFGGLIAVNDVSFTVPKGKVVSLIGPNGAGKTTFFNMLTGVYKPTGGRIVFLGEDVTGKPPHAITERGIGRTFQNIRLFQNMTALENVLVGMHSRMKANLFTSILRTPGVRREERESRQRGLDLLEFTGLRRKAGELAKNLPYGDQRRLEVARALATQPKLLLLDEPTAGMNPQESAEFTAFLDKLRDEHDLTVL